MFEDGGGSAGSPKSNAPRYSLGTTPSSVDLNYSSN